jgi:hypothetical protein
MIKLGMTGGTANMYSASAKEREAQMLIQRDIYLAPMTRINYGFPANESDMKQLGAVVMHGQQLGLEFYISLLGYSEMWHEFFDYAPKYGIMTAPFLGRQPYDDGTGKLNKNLVYQFLIHAAIVYQHNDILQAIEQKFREARAGFLASLPGATALGSGRKAAVPTNVILEFQNGAEGRDWAFLDMRSLQNEQLAGAVGFNVSSAHGYEYHYTEFYNKLSAIWNGKTLVGNIWHIYFNPHAERAIHAAQIFLNTLDWSLNRDFAVVTEFGAPYYSVEQEHIRADQLKRTFASVAQIPKSNRLGMYIREDAKITHAFCHTCDARIIKELFQAGKTNKLWDFDAYITYLKDTNRPRETYAGQLQNPITRAAIHEAIGVSK